MPELSTEAQTNSAFTSNADEVFVKAQALVSTLMESSPDGILVLDRFGTVENLNQLAQILLGTSAGETIGKSVNEVFLAFDPETDEPIDLSSENTGALSLRLRGPTSSNQMVLGHPSLFSSNPKRAPIRLAQNFPELCCS